ncbi:Secretion apparatus protein BsaZ [Paraburkholderia ribeironis]|uniref:Secretion apparatus protein BsaZ n=1 Tax=Paraburkholderia ribeironis TaxID=1247936 RepID=A0A1N7SC39_9BURK|nr:EscU/YscU/HrcU family type III secretion system export apparatus switch protein [Paraburkholderia ribeironis]SIT44968.1 Secretion apparatus protein BsaZ [Paraburkholderia ribeironis]
MAEKTEKPTEKKLRDEAKKGQTFKSKDIVAAIMLAVGATAVSSVVDLRHVMVALASMATSGSMPDPQTYMRGWTLVFLRMIAPFVLLCAAAGALTSLVQSHFTLAVQAVKFDLTAISPAKGFKMLFNWRTVKEVVKALLYVAVCVVTVWIFVRNSHRELFQAFRADAFVLGHLWIKLTVRLVVIFLLCSIPVLLLNVLLEYFLYVKDLKMEVHEVKREYRESQGNPEVKSKRRWIHMELLSEGVKAAIEQSNLLLANPTHIAIGIYLDPNIVMLPFVSVRETNARALAVIQYAESVGVPVVRDIALARSVYRSSRRYSFVSGQDFEAVMRVLGWLKDVEAANRAIELSGTDATDEEDLSGSEEGDAIVASGRPF